MAPRVVLRPPAAGDMGAFIAAARASQTLHRPWVSAPSTPGQFRAWRKRMAVPGHCTLLACRRGGGELAGVYLKIARRWRDHERWAVVAD